MQITNETNLFYYCGFLFYFRRFPVHAFSRFVFSSSLPSHWLLMAPCIFHERGKTRICVVRAMCDVVRALVDCVICFVMMFLRPQKLHRSNSKTMRHQWQRQKGQPPPIGLRLASMHNDEWRLYMMVSEPRRRTRKNSWMRIIKIAIKIIIRNKILYFPFVLRARIDARIYAIAAKKSLEIFFFNFHFGFQFLFRFPGWKCGKFFSKCFAVL